MAQSRARKTLARRHVAFLKPHEDRFARVYRATMSDLNANVNFAERQGSKDRAEWKARVVEAMRPVYHDAMLAAGRNYLTRFVTIRQKAVGLFEQKAARKRATAVIVTLGRSFQDRLEETVDTTFDAMEEMLAEAVEDNLDPDEVNDLIEEEWADVLGRSEVIATTEMNGAVNSVNDYLSLALAELQTWVTAEDDRVRPTHMIYSQAGAKPVGFDWAQLIPDAGYTLRYPCDPECHEASEVVNCRCFPAPSGEVELPPDEMADYLEDFEMDPDDILTSESQETVYVSNRYTGKTVKGDFPGHPFRGNQYTGGVGGGDSDDASVSRKVEFRDPTVAPMFRERVDRIFSEVKRQLDHPDIPPVLRAFIRDKGLRVVYDPNPQTEIDEFGNENTVAGSVQYDPRYADPAILTLTKSMDNEPGIIAHEIGHLLSHASYWSTFMDSQAAREFTPTENVEIMGTWEARRELTLAYRSEGGVTPYAQSFMGDQGMKSTMMEGGPSEQFAEVEGIFQHVLDKAPELHPGKTRSERELGFAWALAKGALDRVGASNFPGGVISNRRFPKTARAWLRHRGAHPDVIREFDRMWSESSLPKPLSELFKKGAGMRMLKHLAGTEYDHDQSTHGSGGGDDKPSMTEVGRALAGAPPGFNSDPRAFVPITFPPTQVGAKREAAIEKEMAKFEKLTMKGGSKDGVKVPDVKVRTDGVEMQDKMEALFKQATPEELEQARWYKEAAGKTVDTLHGQFEARIPGLGKDQVAGILAACSANNVWDDKFGTADQLGGSNQKAAETILRTWADNKPVTVTAEDIAMATAYVGTLEKGAYKGMKMPEPGTYSFQALARSDPRVAYLFNTSWHGADTSEAKPQKVSGPGGAMGFGGMPGHVLPSLGLLRGQAPEAVFGKESKVRSFYSNITNAMLDAPDPNATIDIWLARAMLDKPGADGPIQSAHYKSFVGPPARYEGLRRLIAENAAKHGMEPKQYQAVVWYVIRNQYERREQARNEANRAEEAAAKAAAQQAKRDAKLRAKNARQKKLFEKGFSGLEADLGDDDLALAWLQRFLAHERGANVNADPFFGAWDDLDEEAARSWRATVKGAKFRKGVLTFIIKGDYEGHPFRGNQWTTGHGAAKGDEDYVPAREITSQIESLRDALRKQDGVSNFSPGSKVADELREEIATLVERLGPDGKDFVTALEAEMAAHDRATAASTLSVEARSAYSEIVAANTVTPKEGQQRTPEEQAAYDKWQAAAVASKEAAAAIVPLRVAREKAEESLVYERAGKTLDPKQLPMEDRRLMAGEVVSAIKQDWPSTEEYTALQAKEHGISDRAKEIAAPAQALAEAATERLMAAKEKFSAADREVGKLRDAMHAQERAVTVEKFLELHPNADPTTEVGKAVLREQAALAQNRAQADADTRHLLAMSQYVGEDGKLDANKAWGYAVNDRPSADAGEEFRAKYEAEDAAYRAAQNAVQDAREEIEREQDAVNTAESDVRDAEQTARDEFAQEAGPGYYARKAMQDDAWYNKQMDELRGAWIHIGGEMPMRVRVATGIGLGLQSGAVFDSDLGRFLKPSDYDDLRDDEKTILWAGLLQREYVESQEDIASGKLTKVEHLGESHMGSSSSSSSSSSSQDSPEDTWSDEEKYNTEKAQQDFYGSDDYSNAEHEAMYYEFTHLPSSDLIQLAGQGKAGEREAWAYAGAKLLKENEGINTDEADQSLVDAKLKAELGENYLTTDGAELRTQAVKELQDEAKIDARSDNGLRQMAKVIEDGTLPLPDFVGAAGSAISTEALADVMTREMLGQPHSSVGWTESQIRQTLIDKRNLKYSDASRLGELLYQYQKSEAFGNAVGLTPEQVAQAESAPDEARVAERVTETANENRVENLKQYAEDNLDNAEMWESISDDRMDEVFSNPPKYSGKQTVTDYAQEQFRDGWSWDDSGQAFDNWFQENKSDYMTDEFASEMADYENKEGKYAPDEDEDEEPAKPASSGDKDVDADRKKPAEDRGYIRVFRGIHADDDSYVPNFVESWSTSRKMASSFGSTSVMSDEVPLERVLVFQGARNWRTAGAGKMGSREFEVMVMSDLPKWYREAMRDYLERKRKAGEAAA